MTLSPIRVEIRVEITKQGNDFQYNSDFPFPVEKAKEEIEKLHKAIDLFVGLLEPKAK